MNTLYSARYSKSYLTTSSSFSGMSSWPIGSDSHRNTPRVPISPEESLSAGASIILPFAMSKEAKPRLAPISVLDIGECTKKSSRRRREPETLMAGRTRTRAGRG